MKEIDWKGWLFLLNKGMLVTNDSWRLGASAYQRGGTHLIGVEIDLGDWFVSFSVFRPKGGWNVREDG